IAGSAAAGTKVEIYVNGELLGTADVESSGDWVLVPDERLPTGGVEITVLAPDSEQTAEESVVVVVAEDRSSEPLVVVSTPGAASEVLQGLTRPEDMVVADAEDTADAEPQPEEVVAEPETEAP